MPSSRHTVFIDIESLPTGMEIPSRGHRAAATADTVSNSAASSPGWPAAAIQLADSFTSSSDLRSAAAMFISASATAMRPLAAGSISANGVRSPMAMASPV